MVMTLVVLAAIYIYTVATCITNQLTSGFKTMRTLSEAELQRVMHSLWHNAVFFLHF